MNGSLKAKAIAGVGVAAILSGALLAFAPTFAGAASVDPTLNPGGETNPNCVDVLGPGAIEAKFDSAGNSGESGTASGGGLIVDWTFNDDDTIDFVVDEFSDYAVSAAIVKQGNDANVYVYDPAVVSDTGLVDPRDDGVFSHITFCADGTPNTTTTTEDVQDTTTTTEDVQDTTTTTEDVQDTTTTTEDVQDTTT
ncbi:MAG: hypothetical protein OSA99_15820, partial [Acidimicrobiales bacterium]|nr:hypothetical protein [Acidimicrobiales bacterium]